MTGLFQDYDSNTSKEIQQKCQHFIYPALFSNTFACIMNSANTYLKRSERSVGLNCNTPRRKGHRLYNLWNHIRFFFRGFVPGVWDTKYRLGLDRARILTNFLQEKSTMLGPGGSGCTPQFTCPPTKSPQWELFCRKFVYVFKPVLSASHPWSKASEKGTFDSNAANCDQFGRFRRQILKTKQSNLKFSKFLLQK